MQIIIELLLSKIWKTPRETYIRSKISCRVITKNRSVIKAITDAQIVISSLKLNQTA